MLLFLSHTHNGCVIDAYYSIQIHKDVYTHSHKTELYATITALILIEPHDSEIVSYMYFFYIHISKNKYAHNALQMHTNL